MRTLGGARKSRTGSSSKFSSLPAAIDLMDRVSYVREARDARQRHFCQWAHMRRRGAYDLLGA
jgi:hypothetical protein